MLTKNLIIKQYGKEIYLKACEAAQNDAGSPLYGKGVNSPKQFDSKIAHNISDTVWNSQLAESDKLQLILEFYEEMPCYAYLMYIKGENNNFSETEKQNWWQWVRHILQSDKLALRNPLAYVLLVDFLEDPRTVEESWNALLNPIPSEQAIQIILEESVAVPFTWKQNLYNQLISDPIWHYYIFRSLIGSYYGVYGDINTQEAKRILRKLKLEKDTKGLAKLKTDLGM